MAARRHEDCLKVSLNNHICCPLLSIARTLLKRSRDALDNHILSFSFDPPKAIRTLESRAEQRYVLLCLGGTLPVPEKWTEIPAASFCLELSQRIETALFLNVEGLYDAEGCVVDTDMGGAEGSLLNDLKWLSYRSCPMKMYLGQKAIDTSVLVTLLQTLFQSGFHFCARVAHLQGTVPTSPIQCRHDEF